MYRSDLDASFTYILSVHVVYHHNTMLQLHTCLLLERVRSLMCRKMRDLFLLHLVYINNYDFSFCKFVNTLHHSIIISHNFILAVPHSDSMPSISKSLEIVACPSPSLQEEGRSEWTFHSRPYIFTPTCAHRYTLATQCV